MKQYHFVKLLKYAPKHYYKEITNRKYSFWDACVIVVVILGLIHIVTSTPTDPLLYIEPNYQT